MNYKYRCQSCAKMEHCEADCTGYVPDAAEREAREYEECERGDARRKYGEEG